ncbi:hypothetical protein EJB05_03035, partial [Eragrostis curvula]
MNSASLIRLQPLLCLRWHVLRFVDRRHQKLNDGGKPSSKEDKKYELMLQLQEGNRRTWSTSTNLSPGGSMYQAPCVLATQVPGLAAAKHYLQLQSTLASEDPWVWAADGCLDQEILTFLDLLHPPAAMRRYTTISIFHQRFIFPQHRRRYRIGRIDNVRMRNNTAVVRFIVVIRLDHHNLERWWNHRVVMN